MNADELIHELGDKLNAVVVTVDLAARLLEDDEQKEAAAALQRAKEDCSACAELMVQLRKQGGQ